MNDTMMINVNGCLIPSCLDTEHDRRKSVGVCSSTYFEIRYSQREPSSTIASASQAQIDLLKLYLINPMPSFFLDTSTQGVATRNDRLRSFTT
jgi:hypothetical protein